MLKKLPDVDRIQGLSLLPNDNPAAAAVSVQYTGHNNEWFEVEIPLLDALYLLNLLEDMSKSQGFDYLRHPPPNKN